MRHERENTPPPYPIRERTTGFANYRVNTARATINLCSEWSTHVETRTYQLRPPTLPFDPPGRKTVTTQTTELLMFPRENVALIIQTQMANPSLSREEKALPATPPPPATETTPTDTPKAPALALNLATLIQKEVEKHKITPKRTPLKPPLKLLLPQNSFHKRFYFRITKPQRGEPLTLYYSYSVIN